MEMRYVRYLGYLTFAVLATLYYLQVMTLGSGIDCPHPIYVFFAESGLTILGLLFCAEQMIKCRHFNTAGSNLWALLGLGWLADFAARCYYGRIWPHDGLPILTGGLLAILVFTTSIYSIIWLIDFVTRSDRVRYNWGHWFGIALSVSQGALLAWAFFLGPGP
jgi:hypothetical protein